MRFLSTLAIFGGLLLPLMAARVDPDTIRALIPSGFQGGAASRDPSSYTIRYLSHDDHSEDSPACLASQLNSSTVAYCNSLRYSLQNSTAAGDPQDGPSTFLILLVSPGDYGYGERDIQMSHSRNLIITKNPLLRGEVVFMCDTYDDINYNNLYIARVRNIGVSFLTFAYCGRRSSAFVVSRGENVFVENCVTRNNIGGGMIIYTSRNITVLNSVFRDNMGSSMYPWYSNLTIFLRKGGGLIITYVNTSGSHALVQNCTFVNNTATLNENNLEDAKQRPRLYVPRGHGGGILLSFQNTIDYKVELRDCLFRGNSANFTGGAAAIQFYRGASNTAAVESSSHENVVVIVNTTFTDNSCSEDGGAVSINAFEGANKNNVFLDGNTFSGNYARRNGGALSNIIEDNVLANGTEDTELSSIVIIKRSNFSNNEAILDGGAVIIISNARLDQATASALISDCRFVDNKVGTDGTGALLTLRHPITLKGSNIFQGNMGGALSLFQARMDVSGQVLFENNTALNGGGMLMFDQSILNLEEDVSMVFLNNHARQHGGAIMVVSRSLKEDITNFTIYYRSCFLQFVNTTILPDNYQSITGNISFVGNTAGQGGAIYISYLETCTRNKPRYVSEETQENYYSDSIFTINPPFQFKDNVATMSSGSMKGHDIATEPAYFIVTELPSYTEQGNDHNTKRLFIEDEKIVYSQSQDLYVTPGHILHLLVRAVDLLGTSQSAIFSSSFQEGLFALNAEGKVIEHDIDLDDEDAQQSYESVCSVPYVKGQPLKVLSGQELDFNLLRAIRVDEDVVNTFRLNIVVTCCSPGHTLMNTTCVRTGSLEGDQLFLRYTHDRRYFFIQPLFYAHVQNVSGSVVWASVPVFYQDCSREGGRSGCLFKYDDPDDQCADGRTGFLCGKCPNGTNVDLTLTQCIECGPWHAVVITAIVIAFAVTCALVMIFNIGIPNELRGVLFYIQVVGFVYNYAGIDITWDFHVSNFFGYSSYIPLCLYPGYDALHSAAFGFVFPLTAVATIIIYIISAKFIKHLSNKNSFDGIWFLTFIIYKFTADTCFTILRCQKVNGLSDVTEYVYYYDGDFKCFTGQDIQHLAFATISLLLSVIIILFPIFILVISFKRFQFTVNMTDVLNKDVKKSCRWWASFDLFRRLIFTLVLILFNYLWPLYTQLALFYSGIFVFFVFACTQPYTSKTANISETLVLLNLLVLTAVFLNTDSLRIQGAMSLIQALLLLPFIAVFLHLLCKVVYYYYWRKYSKSLTVPLVNSLRKLKRRIHLPVLSTHTHEEFIPEPQFETTINKDSQESSWVHLTTNPMDDDPFKFPAHPTHQYMHYREELLDESVQ